MKRWTRLIGSAIAGIFIALLGLAACRPGQSPGSTQTPVPSTTTPPLPLPALSLDQTSTGEFAITDLGAVHAPVNGDSNKYLIFGSLAISEPAADLSPEVAVFLGRWEGYSYAPPVRKDWRAVLVVQEITAQGGTAYGWAGPNLQYPDSVQECHFRVVRGDTPSIEWLLPLPDGSIGTAVFSYDSEKDLLRGWTEYPGGDFTYGPWELTRDRSFCVYKDYAQYLDSKRVYSKPYEDSAIQHYGQGYLLYLPEGYETDSNRSWPLILFLHGTGDRGDNVLLLAKASPFMYVRETGPLPFIIVAPLLNESPDYSSFPEAYMDGVLAEAQADYRIDPKRIYVTGLSMGGEATYRFALHQPDAFAAIAPLSAYLDSADATTMRSIKALPVWAIHGADDTVIPLTSAQQPVNALKEAGGNIQFTILEGHDHDVWTDTYSDPAFYDWLLLYQRP